VLAADPEPDMVTGLRERLTSIGLLNVLPVLAADRDLVVIATVCGSSVGVVTVANALQWMDADRVFLQCRRLLRVGGALIVISQGPPMWLSNSAWSRELRAFLARWTGGPLSATCGTDRATLERRALRLRRCGYEQIEVVEHAYENEADLTYVAGHLRSAMSESALPPDREPEFLANLNAALAPASGGGTADRANRGDGVDRDRSRSAQIDPNALAIAAHRQSRAEYERGAARRAAPFLLERILPGNRRNRIEPSTAEDADLVRPHCQTNHQPPPTQLHGHPRAPGKREYLRRQAKPEEAM